ncbi:hypothetical protein D3C84_1236490 [compost metagenome]
MLLGCGRHQAQADMAVAGTSGYFHHLRWREFEDGEGGEGENSISHALLGIQFHNLSGGI